MEGWKQKEVLQKKLYQVLKEEYPIIPVMTTVQGGTEVAAEWYVIGKILGGVFKAVGVTTKTAGKMVVNRLSTKTLMNLAVVELGTKQAIRMSKAGIKTFMKKAGWKAVAAGGTMAVAGSDVSRQRRADELAY